MDCLEKICSLLPNMTFWILALMGIVCAVLAVTVRNLVHAVLFLAGFLMSVAGLFITLEAEFLALVQVLIFVGAIVVLFMFLIMLTHQITDLSVPQGNQLKGVAVIVATVLFGLIFYLLKAMKWQEVVLPVKGDIANIGRLLLSPYVLAFELVSVALLVALIGAIVIARKKE
ncbi:NADH-quinone oxidoreductase subunit J [bacterium]|nr:NADH-quinone oxidoreductase subunit J [bacterium]MBU0899272.1 NADH-quinone oxidoreductase subunit J [bacterium]MBU1153995.1 NADH-quinone oxidoreductase subunit J [bacterium]